MMLYGGAGQKMEKWKNSGNNKQIYTASKNDIIFALATVGTINVCGYKLFKTEHPRLFIVDGAIEKKYFKKNELRLGSLDFLTYLNTKFVFLERHLRNEIVTYNDIIVGIAMYNDIIHQQCALEKQVLHNLLAIASSEPAEFAFRLMKETGYMAHITREVVRISKCVPVDVILRKSEECFQELPVHRSNDSLFMLPRTHILVKTARQIDCNTALTPMFYINNEWIQLVPQVTTAVEPEVLSTKTKHSWTHRAPPNLAVGGIYSFEDLEKFREQTMFAVEKPALLHTIAREASGQESLTQGIYVNSLIDENAIKATLSKAWGKIFGFFNIVGTFSVTIFGAWAILRRIKFIIDTLVHGYALHTVYGWSLWLIGAVWDSVTNLLLHLQKQSEIRRQRDIIDVENPPDSLLSNSPQCKNFPKSSAPILTINHSEKMLNPEQNPSNTNNFRPRLNLLPQPATPSSPFNV